MSAAAVSFRTPVLPWAVAVQDERRFRRILQAVLAACALACVVLLMLPRPQEDRSRPAELSPRLAKLVLEKPVASPPPPAVRPVPATPPPPTAQAPADPPRAERRAAPRVEPAPGAAVPEARNPQPNRPPGEVGEAARRKAAGVGLLAMKDQLAEIRGAPVAVQLRQDLPAGPGVGTGSGAGVGAGLDPGLPARALITANAAGGSGGINTAAYSRNTGGGGLAGRATTLVEGVAGGGGGGGAGGGGGGGKGDGVGGGNANGSAGGAGGASGRGAKGSRSIEEIKLVFERNKGAIYALYNRALREDPSLQGKVVLELKIAPSGEVVGLRIVSSELHAGELEGKLLARVKAFDFGARDVEPKVVTWPIDFLPS